MVTTVVLLAALFLGAESRLTHCPDAGGDVRITQKYLVVVCVDGEPIDAGRRRLRLSVGQHTLAFTMRNSPRTGMPGRDVAPGIAAVRVVLEAGHKYEVETRAAAETYSRRVWARGEWKPVVRDRTTDRIIGGEPEWRDSGCQP